MDTALLGWIYDSSYSFVPNCWGERGGIKLQIFWEKTLQVHLIITREWTKNNPPPILRNLDNFSPGTFYSIPPPNRQPPLTLGTNKILTLNDNTLMLYIHIINSYRTVLITTWSIFSECPISFTSLSVSNNIKIWEIRKILVIL